MTKKKQEISFWSKNYYLIIPISITTLIFLNSLFFGFRNFDEDILIRDFYVKKTFWEYIEKYLLIHLQGVSEAKGFSFSGIQNAHVSILGIPVYYIISYLFKANPFFFHLWGLLLHLIAVSFFAKFCYSFSAKKKIALYSALIWTLHPANVEPVIWATNWAQPLGAAFYFFTLNKIISRESEKLHNTKFLFSISILTLVQILFTEHTITLPITIFLTILYKLVFINKNDLSESFKSALKVSMSSLSIIAAYWILRTYLIASAVSVSSQNRIQDSIERILFFTPQVFFHQFKLLVFPMDLSIDQINLMNLDKVFWGSHHIFCIIFCICIGILIWILRKNNPYLSYGLLLYTICMLPFIQIMPLYSLSGERYNYFGSAFFILGIVSTLSTYLSASSLSLIIVSIILCTCLGIKSLTRINEWKNSETLFVSAINNSKSFFKKGIWTYDLAISQKNEDKKNELLKLSTNLLTFYIQNAQEVKESKIISRYELDQNSLLAKAAIRIATNYEILNNKEKQFKYLLKALQYSRANTQIRAIIYKNLATYYFQNNDFKKCLEYYKKSNKIYPNPVLDYAIAVCYLKLNDFTNYEDYLKKAVSIISVSNTQPFKTYGQLLELSKGNLREAVKYYKIATVLENNPEPYILLASASLRLNEIDNAFKTIQRGLYSFPENTNLKYLYGTILINKGKTTLGIKSLAKVVIDSKSPKDIKIEACHILVSIFLRDHNVEDAVKFNNIALSINPKDTEALNYEASLMLKSGM